MSWFYWLVVGVITAAGMMWSNDRYCDGKVDGRHSTCDAHYSNSRDTEDPR